MIQCVDFETQFQNKADIFFELAFSASGFKYEPVGKHKALRNIQKIFQETGGGFWILMHDEQVIGTTGLMKVNDKTGELKCLYVLPKLMRKGLGKMLMEKVIEESKARGFEVLRLDVKKEALPAINLYLRYGFQEIPRFNDNQNKLIFMQLNLIIM
jgi:ribosomal protein S18 acetylase RimI-like enzyme